MASRPIAAPPPPALSVATPPGRVLTDSWLGLPPWLALSVIALVTCLVYLPALRGEFLWDDESHVTKPALRSAEGLYRIWFDVVKHNPAYTAAVQSTEPKWRAGATQQYYPLLHSAFWIQHRLWGDNTLGYHLVNLFLHLAAACLVYAVLRRLNIPGALLAAALFALHPVHVESVAWITEQKNTLSGVFYLSAALAYLHFDKSRGKTWYVLALVLFVAALLSKTVTATLPAALLVVFWWQRGTISWRRDVLPLAPFFVAGVGFGLFTAWMERETLGAQGEPFFEISVAQRILLAGRIPWFYLSKLVWPVDLTFIYPRWDVDASQPWQWLFPGATVAMTVILWSLRRWSRASLAAWLFFVGTLFPALGFFNVVPFRYSFVADHFQYLASLGPIVLFAAGIATLLQSWRPFDRRLGEIGCAALVMTLAWPTVKQSPVYATAETLYRTTVQRDPGSWFGHNNLGSTLLNHGRATEALEPLREALRLKPDLHQAEYNLATALFHTGQPEEAVRRLQQLVQRKPDYAPARFNLATGLTSVGRPAEALEHYEHYLRLQPDDAEAWGNLALANAMSDRRSEAIRAAERAQELAGKNGNDALAAQIQTWLNKYRRGETSGPSRPLGPMPPTSNPETLLPKP